MIIFIALQVISWHFLWQSFSEWWSQWLQWKILLERRLPGLLDQFSLGYHPSHRLSINWIILWQLEWHQPRIYHWKESRWNLTSKKKVDHYFQITSSSSRGCSFIRASGWCWMPGMSVKSSTTHSWQSLISGCCSVQSIFLVTGVINQFQSLHPLLIPRTWYRSPFLLDSSSLFTCLFDRWRPRFGNPAGSTLYSSRWKCCRSHHVVIPIKPVLLPTFHPLLVTIVTTLSQPRSRK